MTKIEAQNRVSAKGLAKRLSQLTGLSTSEARLFLSVLGTILSEELASGHSPYIANFGRVKAKIGLSPVTLRDKQFTRTPPVRVIACCALRNRLRVAAKVNEAEANGT